MHIGRKRALTEAHWTMHSACMSACMCMCAICECVKAWIWLYIIMVYVHVMCGLTTPDSVMTFGSSVVKSPSGIIARLRVALSFSDAAEQMLELTFHQPVLYQPGVSHTYLG